MNEEQDSQKKIRLTLAAESFFPKYNLLIKAAYRTEISYLEKYYKNKTYLPSRIGLSEAENARYDINRLKYICRALAFLCNYYRTGQTALIGPINQDEQEFWEYLSINNVRMLIEHIVFCIFNLSSDLRYKYKHLLAPAPFTWETFEQLGGFMKVSHPAYKFLIIKGVPDEVAERFFNEYLAKEAIVEAAIQSIIDRDIPLLKTFFERIYENETAAKSSVNDISPVNLIAIKALVRRTADCESLVQLLSITDNNLHRFPHGEAVKQLEKKEKNSQMYYVEAPDNNNPFQRLINLSTKLGKHAALRRLERLGELLKGKNFSSYLMDLDPTINWRAFITLRDVIAHQDEHDNKRKIDLLLQNEKRFMVVLDIEIQEFFRRLCQIIVHRDQHLPFCNNPEQFWQEVLRAEEQAYAKTVAPSGAVNNSASLRVTFDEMKFFIEVLRQNKASQDIQLQWVAIFNGRALIPNKKDYGQLLKHLPSRKENKELYNKCKAIADKAVKPKSELEQRQLARQLAEEQARERQLAEEARLTGLVEIRRLAKEFTSSVNSAYVLTREKRVNAAIEALENIKQFMEQDEFVQANFNFASLAEWNKNQTKEKFHEYLARLLTNPEFNDAIEYNAAQLLQHLDKIKTFDEAKGKGYRYIDNDYEALRILRNWLEHGNPLFDKEDYDPGKPPAPISDLQMKVGPIMVTLIFELLPTLKQIKAEIAANTDVHEDKGVKATTLHWAVAANDKANADPDMVKLPNAKSEKVTPENKPLQFVITKGFSQHGLFTDSSFINKPEVPTPSQEEIPLNYAKSLSENEQGGKIQNEGSFWLDDVEVETDEDNKMEVEIKSEKNSQNANRHSFGKK